MQILDVLWIFLIVSSLQPIIRQRILEAARVRLLRDLEHLRSSRVIVLIHRQETLSLLGFPVARYIDIQDSEDILRAIQLTGDDVPIDLILHTPGGLVLAAEQIAYALGKASGEGDGVRAPLRHVGRHADRAGGRRDRHGRQRRPRARRSSDRSVPGAVHPVGRRAEERQRPRR